MKFRGHYDYDVEEASNASAIGPGPEPGLTVQSMADDADINVIMKRFGLLGQMPEVGTVKVPQYGDYEHITDYQSALHAIRDAEENFMLMPAEVRSKFQNNPQVFLDFASNPANMGALVDLGLASRREVSNGSQVNSQVHSGAGAQGSASAGGAAGDARAAVNVSPAGGSGGQGGGSAGSSPAA